MKLTSKQVYNLRDRKPNNITRIGASKSPLNNSNLNFGSNLPVKLVDVVQDSTKIIFKKTQGNIKCNNAQELIKKLDRLFGEETFSKKLLQIGVNPNEIGDELILKHRTFLKDDVLKTLLFPVDIFTSLAEKFSKTFKKEYKEDGFVQKLIDQKHQDQARDWILDVLEEFSKNKYGKELDLNKSFSDFEDMVSSNITKTQKGYATRDERTLNRIVTSCVSAIYAGWDFFNISMLEKDNKEEAKEAQKGRLKQELTRMAYNASLTFVALGMLDRYTKKNIILNSLVIAGSALVAEISSRLKSGTPLKALSPEEAVKVAQLRKAKKEKAKHSNQKVNFKANLKTEDQIFNNFTAKNGNIKAVDIQKRQIANETNTNNLTPLEENKPKKKMKVKKAIGLAFVGASIIFFISKALKGDFRAIKDHKEFLQKYGGEDKNKNYFVDNLKITLENIKIFGQNIIKKLNKEDPIEKLDLCSKQIYIDNLEETELNEARDLAAGIAKRHKDSKDSFSIWAELQKILTTKKTSVLTKDVIKDLENLKNDPKAKDIEGILEAYIDHAKKYAQESRFVETNDEIFLVSGVVKGFSKIFKTIYDVFTIPAKALNALIESATGADINAKAFEKANKKLNPSAKKYNDELMKIHKMIEKSENIDELINSIKALSRNVEVSQETGDLANISRTMVTAISTYFFVNDYRNTVLIESEGKNVQGAKEEMTERIWHKVFNFIFNGTLMNVFNTTFAKIVNGSLIGAAGIAAATETTNEFLIRKSLCQPVLPKDSKQDIIDFEIAQIEKEGAWGAWSRFFKKITGKKTLTQKAGIDTKKLAQEKELPTSKVKTHQG